MQLKRKKPEKLKMSVGELYEIFVRKRAPLVKYQSQCAVIEVMLCFIMLKNPINFENLNSETVKY